MKKLNLNEVKIQEFTLGDINTILDIQKELNIHILSKENIKRDFNNLNFKYFIAKYENVIVGFFSFSLVTDIEIESIVVKKAFQRMGIGNLLLNYIFDFAKSNKVGNIFLEVRISNFPAISLYIKNGFEKLNIRKNYYSDTNEDAIILKKTIIFCQSIDFIYK